MFGGTSSPASISILFAARKPVGKWHEDQHGRFVSPKKGGKVRFTALGKIYTQAFLVAIAPEQLMCNFNLGVLNHDIGMLCVRT